MAVAVFRKKKARVGRENGRSKLIDAEIRLARAFAAFLGRASAEACFGVCSRHINQVRTGARRLDAGGIIVSPQVVADEGEAESVDFDDSLTIRCKECGAKTHPSVRDKTRCPVCVNTLGPRN
jgi:hypothetical protein